MTSSFNTNPDTGTTETTFENPADTQTIPEVVQPPTLTAEELAALTKRDTNAQSHIATLEAEAAQRKTELETMQAKLDQAAEVEDLLRQQETNTTPVNVDDIVAKATQALSDQQQATAAAQQADTNFKEVSNVLSAKYGADKVDTAVQAACEENGMTFEAMVQLAKTNPKAAMKLCDVTVKPDAAPTMGTINSSAVMQTYQQPESTTPVNVMELRTDKERVADYQRRMAEFQKNNS